MLSNVCFNAHMLVGIANEHHEYYTDQGSNDWKVGVERSLVLVTARQLLNAALLVGIQGLKRPAVYSYLRSG